MFQTLKKERKTLWLPQIVYILKHRDMPIREIFKSKMGLKTKVYNQNQLYKNQ